MIGIIAHKKEMYYTAKWVSHEDKDNYGYFKFKIVGDDNLTRSNMNNMSGLSGGAIWQTKSGLPFMPDDIIIFRSERFNITNVDGNRKAEPENERAYMRVNNVGNLLTTLTVRKAG